MTLSGDGILLGIFIKIRHERNVIQISNVFVIIEIYKGEVDL